MSRVIYVKHMKAVRAGGGIGVIPSYGDAFQSVGNVAANPRRIGWITNVHHLKSGIPRGDESVISGEVDVVSIANCINIADNGRITEITDV